MSAAPAPWRARLAQRARQLKTEVLALALAIRHRQTPWHAKLLLLAIVAYALSPIDLIPDFIPVLGLLDDLVLLPFAIVLALRLVPAAVMDECRARARDDRSEHARLARIGATVIVLVWIALAAAAGFGVYRLAR